MSAARQINMLEHVLSKAINEKGRHEAGQYRMIAIVSDQPTISVSENQ